MIPARGSRTKSEIVSDYRADKAARGECRECKRPVKIKANGKPARLCATHAAGDYARKLGAITRTDTGET